MGVAEVQGSRVRADMVIRKTPSPFSFCFRFHGNRDYATVLSISVSDPSSIVVLTYRGQFSPRCRCFRSVLWNYTAQLGEGERLKTSSTGKIIEGHAEPHY